MPIRKIPAELPCAPFRPFPKSALEFRWLLEYGLGVHLQRLREYQKAALKLAEIKHLDPGEGYSARIPGFAGLIVFGETKSEVMVELESALEGWMEVSLKRGNGLPSLHQDAGELVTAH